MASRLLPMMVLFTIVCLPVSAQVANFNIPDTVCVNTPVKIQNTSTGGSTYFWNFCSGSLFSTPVVSNLGNVSGALNLPSFLSMTKDGSNYYAFITNNIGQLVRYSFGNSFLNTPVVSNLGNLGGVIPNHTEGVQVIQDINGWHVIVVGGTSEISPRIVKVDFGSSLANAPVATNWGNMGGMDYPHDLYITQEGSNWYGFTVSILNHTVTRFDFGNSVGNMPTAVNLGNLGSLNRPTGIFATQDNGNWYVFVTNEGSNTITRLDFGNSLANTPTGTNLGSGGGIVNGPRDISIIHDCGKIFGLVVSAGSSDLTRIDFTGGITSNFTATALNAGSNFNFPSSISPIFREGNDLYAFITNVYSNTLSRFVFNSCNSSSIASSTVKDPPDVAYNTPGTYTINLLMDEALATQTTYCRSIVVLNPPVVNLGPDRSICEGGKTVLDAGSGFSSYKWSTGETTQQITVNAAGTYQVEVSNGGCTATDDITISTNQVLAMTTTVTDATSLNPKGKIEVTVTGGAAPYAYYIDGNSHGNNVFDNLDVGGYTILVADNAGCWLSRPVEVNMIVIPPPPMASFNIPDTVCVNTPIKIQNTSTGGSTYFWNFCSGNLFSTPVVSNLGNVNGNLNVPTYLSMAKDGNNYYAFITNNTGQLIRYNFGNSFLNAPSSDNFGNLGGVIPNHTEGVQVIQDINGWHVIVVGGTSEISPRIVKVDFGSSLANPPVPTNWGSMGNMDYPHDLYITQEGSNWYGFAVNILNHTITRFDFGNSVGNMPTAVNLGNLGNLNSPTGIFATQDNGNWYVFVTNQGSNTITRLDFGSSLANTPTGVNLGDGGGIINGPRDISIIHDCGKIFGLVVSAGSSDLTRIDFTGGITSNFTATALNAGGNFSFPHSISPIFREGNDLYAFITNATSNTLSRFVFNSCNSSSIASSTLKDPPDVSYNTPGTYTMNLLMDESLTTQATYCRTIVVLDPPVVNLGPDRSLCVGGTAVLDAGSGFSSYKWSTGETTQQITVSGAGTYTVEVSNGGCTATDDVTVNIGTMLNMTVTATDITCTNPKGKIEVTATGGIAPYTYYNGSTDNGNNNVFDNLDAGLYSIQVRDDAGCAVTNNVRINAAPVLNMTATVTDVTCADPKGKIEVTVTGGTAPYTYYNGSTDNGNNNVFDNLDAGLYSIQARDNTGCTVTSDVRVNPAPVLNMAATVTDVSCINAKGKIDVTATGGAAPYTYYIGSTNNGNNNVFDNLDIGSYTILVEDNGGCRLSRLAEVKNDLTITLDVSATTTPPTCYGDADGGITIQVNNGTGPFEYALQRGGYQPSPDFSGLSAGSYVVSVRNTSCNVDVPVNLTGPAELKLTYNKADEYCGERNGEVIAVAIGGTPPYTYYWDNVGTSADITGLQAGAYGLSVTDQRNCAQQSTVILDNIILPPVNIINSDTTINIGQSVQLHAVNAIDYTWTPATDLSCVSCADPIATPRQTTTYTVTTTDKNCSKTDMVTVFVTFNNSLYVPTAFTPNGDGVNDRFVVKSRGVAVYNIQIFNRWGQQVFASNNVSVHWDGKFKGQLQPAGAYVYIVTYSFYGQEQAALMQKGAFTLIR
ncbi:T9SS type B sorting domain-containing protein [Chitinophaga filiformis]|uniref:Gliding motility-associated C-terminal domain-containing protein n=1 Tax=Chitinophaga filiformis TaxID=104663 RepID=A0A1G7P3J7_CHIFI|nr:gliding motility-associated C-terminal domain-containing protein [Chitinophaga filiformis]SDF80687.1 gliding motility-associated C-terminal domain-containing protein [Chitinophaga filiformis]